MSEQPTIDELAELWRQTKAAEEKYRQDRISLENALLERIKLKEEGSTTTKTEFYKITATTKLSRSVDWDAWDKVAPRIPETLRPVRIKRELDTTGCKWIEKNEPDLWRLIAACISTKPAKSYIRVDPLGDLKP